MQTKMFEIPQPKSLPHWRETPIQITEAARRSDPLKITGGDVVGKWWEHCEPSILRDRLRAGRTGSGSGRRNYGRDGKAEENTEVGPEGLNSEEISREQEEQERARVEDAYQFADYLPEPTEDLFSWLTSLRIYIQQTDERKSAFDALDRYVQENFSPGARGEDADLERLSELLTELCEAPGDLLVRRPQ